MARKAKGQTVSDPCDAPIGVDWIWAKAPNETDDDLLLVGKWLIYVRCFAVEYCWSRVRAGTEEGVLGVGAKVITDWALRVTGGKTHVICVYTRDYRDTTDVLRVATALHNCDAVRKQVIHYKPDVFTHGDRYAGADHGASIYSCRAPYKTLEVDQVAFQEAEGLRTALAEQHG